MPGSSSFFNTIVWFVGQPPQQWQPYPRSHRNLRTPACALGRSQGSLTPQECFTGVLQGHSLRPEWLVLISHQLDVSVEVEVAMNGILFSIQYLHQMKTICIQPKSHIKLTRPWTLLAFILSKYVVCVRTSYKMCLREIFWVFNSEIAKNEITKYSYTYLLIHKNI